MNIPLESSWSDALAGEFSKEYYQQLMAFVTEQYQEHTCYPPNEEIFAGLNACPLPDIKVVIIGQDPYHGYGQANGLCFSVKEGIAFPPSLHNIYKELQADLGIPTPPNGDLFRWAKQGVLLLNTVLTVREKEADSHKGQGWEIFTDEIIRTVSKNCSGVVFLLWGGKAKAKLKLIDQSKHFILQSGHPSPLSANRGLWFGNKHFSQANTYLKERSITW